MDKMRKIFYTMHFRGQTSPATSDTKVLRTTASATSSVLHTHIRDGGIESELQASDGQLAFLEVEFRLTGAGAFQGNGTITLGEESEHVLKLVTTHNGHVDSNIESGLMAGTSSWKVEGGEGQFAAAQGLVTSIFTLTSGGEFTDYQMGVLFFPE
jgi:hypothetical protein